MDTVPVPAKRQAFVSYSINYEDVILRRLFGEITDGFFVDVGANHPRFDNDFFALTEVGWRGINIEPEGRAVELLRAERPRDVTFQAVLSDIVGEEIAFFEVEGSGLSTCDAAQAEFCAARGYTVHRRSMRTTTLAALLWQALPERIDVLKVDVEGFEEKVLRGNDWAQFRPSVIVVEATFPETAVRRPSQIAELLSAEGYRHIYFDNLNDFYAAPDFIVPPGATLPPNVFDNFVRYETVRAEEECTALRSSFEEAESYAHALEADRDQLRAAVAELAAINTRHETTAERLREAHRALITASDRTTQFARFTIALVREALAGNRAEVERLILGIWEAGRPASDVKRRVPVLEDVQNVDSQLVRFNSAGEERTHDSSAPPELHLDFLGQVVRALTEERARLAQDVADLRHENRRLTAALNQLRGENSSLARALLPAHAVTDEVALLNRSIQQLSARLGLGTRIEQPPALTSATSSDEEVRRRLADAEAMLRAVYRSTSWRVTGPLRAVRRMLKS